MRFRPNIGHLSFLPGDVTSSNQSRISEKTTALAFIASDRYIAIEALEVATSNTDRAEKCMPVTQMFL
jgi:hypothetical protein